MDDPHSTEAILRVNGLLKKVVKVAAFNGLGTGPFSNAATIEFDPQSLKDPLLFYNTNDLESMQQPPMQYTWLIALLGSLAFVLVLLAFVMVYYRQKPKYLAANTSDSENYHCTLKSASAVGGQLWIDRYFEKEAKQQLMASATMPNVKATCDNNEYAYIDNSDNTSNRHSLSTFAMGISGGLQSSYPASMATSMMTSTNTEPEPYATTDILKDALQQHNHYAVI